ncbi:hypothetical protein HHK36_010837 [Tetracentron sinense]|uniref:Senescence regulator n=1 Tax=Tetracentron sinense TaxID=13715 RepID=A0A834ZA95_TETSI|nr:hypothetical protein HHK36_010837 [Tetracentron sinense]
MAAGNSYLARTSYRFLPGKSDNPISSETMFEFDEADVWNNSNHVASPEIRKSIPSSRVSKKSVKRVDDCDRSGTTAGSLPMNIPDWSKILREDFRDNRRTEIESDVDYEDEDSRVPPHEFLARQYERTRIASFSVHEGVGRTLKGRDLSRVRNAIWKKTGFED